MRWLLVISAFLIFAAVGTFVRYGSYDTCDWLVTDTASTYRLSPTAAEARARADLLLRGVVDPDAMDCLHAWWRVRRDVS